MLVYRIGSSRYAANDGKGAAQFGGRWNHKGVPLIYAAESRALCALEILAGGREFAHDFTSITIEVPDDLPVRILPIAELPAGWDSPEQGTGTRELGTTWANATETAILVVPSAVLLANATTSSIRDIRIFHESSSTLPSHFSLIRG